MDATLKNKQLKQKILEASRAIKKKYLQLKLDRAENDEALNYIIKPITEPLREMNKNVASIATTKKEEKGLNSEFIKESSSRIKSEIKKDLEQDELIKKPVWNNSYLQQYEERKKRRETLPAVHFLPEENIGEIDTTKYGLDASTDVDEDIGNNDVFNVGDADEAAEGIYYEQFPEPAHEYIKKFLHDHKDIDRTNFALKHDPQIEKWYIGKSVIDFSLDGNIYIDNEHKFNGTPGMYELLFYRSPKNYTENDKENYKKILNLSKALSYSTPSINSTKYKFILNRILSPQKKKKHVRTHSEPSTSSKKRGGSINDIKHFKILNNKHPEYIYWNDPNELVDRLRLLASSTSVGNNSHHNEIISILEELNEMGIIVFK